jgi:hypothetical protein
MTLSANTGAPSYAERQRTQHAAATGHQPIPALLVRSVNATE